MNTIVEISTPLLITNANKVSDVAPKPQGLCSRLACGMASCLDHFNLGVGSAAIIIPVSGGVSYLAGKAGLIQVISSHLGLIKKVAASDAIGNLMNGLVLQIGSSIPRKYQSVFALQVGLGNVGVPIAEEILFRGLIQDLLLTRIPKYVIKKIAPGKEKALDTKIVRAICIIITAAHFSATHLVDSEILDDSFSSKLLVSTFVGGIGLGILKESKAGLLGAIGCHIANNMISYGFLELLKNMAISK